MRSEYVFITSLFLSRVEMMQFCVLNCEDKKAWLPINFSDMFISNFGIQGDKWTVCNIACGEQLPENIFDYDGVLLTGSHYNCRHTNTGLPWFDPLFQFIRDADKNGYPNVYGSCFGAQVIARALGGYVDFNPSSSYILKAETMQALPDFFTFFGEQEQRGNSSAATFSIISTHEDCIAKLPDSAIVLAKSVSCQCEAFAAGRLRKNFLGVQGHPEFDLQYAVLDRIWPAIALKKKRLSEEEMSDSLLSFQTFRKDDSDRLCSLISRFLRSPVMRSTV